MFALAFLLGLYANCIFLLGIASFLNKTIIIAFTIAYIFLAVIFWKKFDDVIDLVKIKAELLMHFKKNPVWVLLIFIALSVIFIGILIPETAFDALWYHLTLPKLYLSFGAIRYIPGGLFYYSTMPKLGELFYTSALAFGSDTLAHTVHFSFAILTLIVLYILSKKYTSSYFALLSVAILLSNIVFMWEATTAYIDLIRTFFEVMSLWGMLKFLETKKKNWLVEAAILLGLAIESKFVAVASIPIPLIVILFYTKDIVSQKIKNVALFVLLSFLPSLPWLVFSYIHTGNPIYPLFSGYPLHVGKDVLAFPQVITDTVTVFIHAADPVSPLYLIFIPLIFLVWKHLKTEERMFVVLSGVAMIIWTLTPKTGGGRFLLPYLPLLSLTLAVVLYRMPRTKSLIKISTYVIFVVFLITIAYRGLAEGRAISVIAGEQSRQDYLAKHLHFSYGDYFDRDQTIQKIVKDRNVLLYGFHNLYYVDFPFIDSSYVEKGDKFTFVATQNVRLPQRFAYWTPIYFDSVTNVTLYTVGQEWIY